MTIQWRTIGFPEHLMKAEAGSFRLAPTQMASGSQVANFTRAVGLIAMRWQGRFDMTQMERDDWQEWDSWVARLSGQAVLFEIHSPAQPLPLGVGAGYDEDNTAYPITGVTITGVDVLTGATTGLVVADQPRYSHTVKIDFGIEQAGEVVLKHGDRFGIGGNLYLCVANVTADANGHARVPFRWRLHKAARAGDIVNFRNPTCRVHLSSAQDGQTELAPPYFGKPSLSFIEVPYF